MKKQHYRTPPSTAPLLPPMKPNWHWLHRFAGGFRTAPFNLAVYSDRWFQRGPEQFNFAFKNVHGTFQADLSQSICRPKYHAPIVRNRKTKKLVRVPDTFYQHTRSWRYCLDNASHTRALQQLLRHAVAYTAGHDAGALRQGEFKDLYWRDVGTTKEIARWPIKGLCSVVNGSTQLGLDGHEVLEVVCIPGERPTRPKTLCGPRPYDKDAAAHYDGVKRHWHKQLQACRSKEMQLRVRRVHGPNDEPAFYFNSATEMDLPLYAVRGWMRLLPSFWKFVYETYEKEAGRSWPRMNNDEGGGQERVYEVYPALWMTKKQHRDYFWKNEIDQHGRVVGKFKREREKLGGSLNDQRQFNWNQEVVQRLLSPSIVESICANEPQDGLWKKSWSDKIERGSDDYIKRLALWEAGLLRWDTEWSIGAEDALDDLTDLNLQQDQRIKQALQFFLISCAIKFTRRRCRERPVAKEPLKLQSYLDRYRKQARGPPTR